MKKISLACIIDDDPSHVYIAKTFLNKTGLVESILTCSNGKDAFNKFNQFISLGKKLPELVLLDIDMPLWDGWQFLEEFRGKVMGKKMKIYILTSSISKDDLKKARNFNMENNYIVKPFTFDVIEEIVKNL